MLLIIYKSYPMIYRHEKDQPCLRKYIDDHHKDPGQQHSGPAGSGNHEHVFDNLVDTAFMFYNRYIKIKFLQSLN